MPHSSISPAAAAAAAISARVLDKKWRWLPNMQPPLIKVSATAAVREAAAAAGRPVTTPLKKISMTRCKESYSKLDMTFGQSIKHRHESCL